MANESQFQEGNGSVSQPKKAFSDPHLVTYGDIRQITNAIGKVGAADAGGKGKTVKTR